MSKPTGNSAQPAAPKAEKAGHVYQAPEHTSAVFTSALGELRADKHGLIRIPADAPASTHAQLRSVGCEIHSDPAPAADAPAASEGAQPEA